jgi:hypothetical protein
MPDLGINGDRLARPQSKFCDLLHTRRSFLDLQHADLLLSAYLLGEEWAAERAGRGGCSISGAKLCLPLLQRQMLVRNKVLNV